MINEQQLWGGKTEYPNNNSIITFEMILAKCMKKKW